MKQTNESYWSCLRSNIRTLMIIVCCCILAAPMLAETMDGKSINQTSVTVKGTITDEHGDPLIGVSVAVEGTALGVVTDINGKYSINLPNEKVTLNFTYLGFIAYKQKVDNRREIDVVMKEDVKTLDEVVVTALGMTRDAKALGYSMTELKGDDLIKSNVVNPVTALQGKVAGVQIDMGAAGPQSSQRILIRGNTSMQANNQPIFVVDGIIVDNEISKTGDKFDRDFGNELKSLNADDFETVSVLKGAAATALYGSRASNGVILITTKKGRKNTGIGVSFSHTQQWESIYKLPDFQNEFGFGTYPLWPLNNDGTENRNYDPSGQSRNWGPRYDGKPYTVGGTDYQGTFQAYPDNVRDLYDTGRYVNTNVAVSGGSKTGSFRMSYSNLTTDGITANNEFDRNSVSLNATQEISKWLTADAGFSYVKAKSKNPTYQGGDRSPLYDFMYAIVRDYDSGHFKKNYWSKERDGYNPDDPWGYSSTLFDWNENNEIQKEEYYRGFMNVTVAFTDWLKLLVNGDMNRSYTTREYKTLATLSNSFGGAQYRLNERKKLQYKLSGMVTATKKFGDFGLGASVGVEKFDEKHSWHNSRTVDGLRIPGKFDLSNSVSPPVTEAWSNKNTKRINSVYGLINADWKGQVYVDVTGRNDWSSTLRYVNGTGNVSYFFPSVGASWLVKETFKEQLPDWISFLKLRASYAIVGNGTDPYAITNSGMFMYKDLMPNNKWGQGNLPYYDFRDASLGSPSLKPEKQHAIELGFDYRVFDNRLGIDFAYYKTNTKNQILRLPLSTETGANYQYINAGDIENQGIEILLSGNPIRTDEWNWDVTFTFTKNKNKIKKLADGVQKFKLWGGGSDVSAWATEGGSYGDLYTPYAFKRNEDGIPLMNSSGGYIRTNEDTKVGKQQPDFIAGFTSSLSWKSLTLSAVLDGTFGGHVMSGSYYYGMAGGKLKSSLYGRTQEYGGLERTLGDDRVVYDGMIPYGVFDKGVKLQVGKDDKGNPITQDVGGMSYKEAMDKGYISGPQSAYIHYANQYDWANGIRELGIKKRTFVALRELSLYWSIPKQWTRKVFIKDASLGFTVRNVAYLYNSLPDNIHPEGLATTYSSEFYEAGGVPFTRSYSLKLSLNF